MGSPQPKEPEQGSIIPAQSSLLQLPIKFLISAPKRSPCGESERPEAPGTCTQMDKNHEELLRNSPHTALPSASAAPS